MPGLNVTMKVFGVEGLEKKLEPKNLIGNATKNLLSKAALIVERKAKENATGRPGPNVISGRLRSSITHKVEPTFAKVGTNVFYAPYVELGHLTRGGDMAPAYPFLHPALEQAKPQIEPLLKEAGKNIEGNFSK